MIILDTCYRILSVLKTWVGTGREEFQKNQKFVELLKTFVIKECKMLKSKEEESIVSGFLNDIFLPYSPKFRSIVHFSSFSYSFFFLFLKFIFSSLDM
jgi:hypothetical protein